MDDAMDDAVFQEYNGVALNGVNDMRQALGAPADAMTLGGALADVRRKMGLAEGKAEADLFHWHLANLEFANATRLDELSLGQWDQDDPYEFGGEHEWLPHGNARLVNAMARDVPVFYGHAAREIRYPAAETDREGGGDDEDATVTVTCRNGRAFVADAVVVTVPLGVLKHGDVAFDPPLPERKRLAVSNLGFGVLNKVVLLFPRVFWGDGHDTFGYVNRTDGPEGGESPREVFHVLFLRRRASQRRRAAHCAVRRRRRAGDGGRHRPRSRRWRGRRSPRNIHAGKGRPSSRPHRREMHAVGFGRVRARVV